jgi:hypothetical protein
MISRFNHALIMRAFIPLLLKEEDSGVDALLSFDDGDIESICSNAYQDLPKSLLKELIGILRPIGQNVHHFAGALADLEDVAALKQPIRQAMIDGREALEAAARLSDRRPRRARKA